MAGGRRLRQLERLCESGKTVVVGGGNTAMDCARTALRLGGDVTVVYRRTQKEMPAEQLEVLEAMEEGVKFEFLTAPLSLKKNADGKLALTCQKMVLGEPDASGRRSPASPTRFGFRYRLRHRDCRDRAAHRRTVRSEQRQARQYL